MKLSEYAVQNNITYRTAHTHWKKGYIKGRQLTSGTIVVQEEEALASNNQVPWAIYCRVSSHDQKQDLERQKERLLSFAASLGYKISFVETEIASGLDDRRPKLMKLLDAKCSILIEHKDRLTRFGYNYINYIVNSYGGKIEIINTTNIGNPDIIQDFISIITSFCAKIYGTRKSKRKIAEILEEVKT
jgi:putative resolvase